MRVVIIFDMEGTSHVADWRELFPLYREYWRTGRQKLTNDVVAAARGLLDGGATEVIVLNHHGGGETDWPNLVNEWLPEGVRQSDLEKPALRENVDAMFLVGCHARGGSRSFVDHTILPGLRLRLDGELLSESHWWAMAGNVPVLGIVGSTPLAGTLGSLSGVPFLAVQASDDRRSARPVFAGPDETSAAIRRFAAAAIRTRSLARSLAPRDFTLEASLQNGDDSAPALAAAGWVRTSRTEFRIEGGVWRDVDDAVDAAIDATWVPYSFLFDGIDPTSEETSLAFPPDRLARSKAALTSWVLDETVEWITPESAKKWEGMEHGQA